MADQPAAVRVIPSLTDAFQGLLPATTEQELRDLLADRAAHRTPFNVLRFSAKTRYAKQSELLATTGWTANRRPALRLVPPIDWGEARESDINWHFQLNSLRPAAVFLMAARQDGARTHLNRMLAIAADWIEYNLVEDRPNAKKWFDHAAGLRAHYLSALLDELLRRGAANLATVRSIVWALRLHGAWLADPTHCSRTNHVLYMALGLRSICAVLPELPQAGEWAGRATRMALDYLESAVSSEGVSLEHSPEYQIFVAESLAQLSETGLFDEGFVRVTELMRSESVWMFHPDGSVVQIGDSEGKARPGRHARVDFALTDGRDGAAPEPAPVAFPGAGIAVLRSSWSEHPYQGHAFLFFSAAYHSTVHKHRDDFTFEWSDAGSRILVDSGKFTYQAGPERDFFCSTRASNTVEIDEQDYPLSAKEAFGSALTDWGATAGGLQYVAASVHRRSQAVRHDRVIVLQPHQWLLVVDRLRSDQAHTYRQWFGFHDAIQLELGPELASAALPSGAGLQVRALSKDARFEIVKGQPEPRMQGWISHQYQQRVPRHSLAVVGKGRNVVLSTLFSIGEATGVRHVANGEQLAIAFRRLGHLRSLVIDFEAGAIPPTRDRGTVVADGPQDSGPMGVG